ncbi:hypothetical protein [Phenylobacterium immobile]|uniref:hypothetical protein n=1 Tax=Phenylobacterium immobile TaxID=21 RepID=UPI000B072D41|nr:hypothetical protein [Phenylobacterium immobile]
MSRVLNAIRRRLAPVAPVVHPDRQVVAAEFDAAFYLAANPDVARAGTDPLDHFLVHGWREGRDPTRRFSLKDYMDAYPDVAEAGVNPFVHFVGTGRAEGRTARLDLGLRYDIVARLKPLDQRLAERLKVRAMLSPIAALERALAAADFVRLHLTFSHDDVFANVGGLQLCVQREAAAQAARGGAHLHIFPADPWPIVRPDSEPSRLGVILNGVRLGVFEGKDIARVLSGTLSGASSQRSFAIHSLLGQTAAETIAIVRACGLTAGWFWLHDFASLCAGVHLLRNDVADCGAPAPGSAACGVCLYRPRRMDHIAAHEALFSALSLTVASPSEAALATWRAGWPHAAAGEVVHPHARLEPAGETASAHDGALRVAFLGAPAAHKGWGVFCDLALRFEDDPRYSFHHLGVAAEGATPVEFRAVRVSPGRPDAMAQALSELAPDVALIWPLCQETFSFTAYEATAAGAAVVTNPDSGNVAAFVAQTGLGQVLEDDAALVSAFETGDILALSRRARPRPLFNLAMGALTFDLMTKDLRP